MDDSMGGRLKQLREEKKLRQVQVADLIGVNKRQISAYENNIRQPSYEILLRLAALYHVSTDYILGNTPQRTLDVSGLTQRDYGIVSDLVEDMTDKNRKLDDQ